jgi:tetratricopeptide (TPR) repeat protein
MAKERDRRYATANDMADDLIRFLEGQPVDAGPPSVTYRLSRYLRRHRAGAVVATILVVALIGFLTLVIWDNARVHAAEQVALARANEAERERALTEAINTFLNDDLLAAVVPSMESGRGHEVTMREVLDAASENIEGTFPDDPRIEASVRSTLGRTYLALGLLDSGEIHLRRAFELNEQFNGPEHKQTLGAMDELTMLLLRLDQLDEAEANLRKLIKTRERLYGHDALVTIMTIEGLGVLMKGLGRFDESEECYLVALEAKQRINGPEHVETLLTMDNIAKLHMAQGRFEESNESLERIIEIRERVWGPDHPLTLDSKRIQTACLRELGRFEESERLCIQLAEPQQRVYGPEHFRTFLLMETHALTLCELGRYQEGADLMAKAVAGMTRLRDPDHSALRVSQIKLAQMQARLGNSSDAEARAAEAVESLTRTQGRRHPTTLAMMRLFAEILSLQNRPQAEEILRENLALQREVLGPDHPETLRSASALERIVSEDS